MLDKALEICKEKILKGHCPSEFGMEDYKRNCAEYDCEECWNREVE